MKNVRADGRAAWNLIFEDFADPEVVENMGVVPRGGQSHNGSPGLGP